MGILTPLSTTVMRGSTTLSSPLESIALFSEQYLTSTSSKKLYFLLNSANFSGVSTIDLNFPIIGKAGIKKKDMAEIKSKE